MVKNKQSTQKNTVFKIAYRNDAEKIHLKNEFIFERSQWNHKTEPENEGRAELKRAFRIGKGF